MRVLQSWLQQYISFALPPEQLAERLTMLGLEFERIEHLGEKYEGIVVGEVLACAPHPRADRLTLCTVGAAHETFAVVCGAPNVAEGQKVALALVGATVPRDQHDPAGEPLRIRRAEIRGVMSEGMICSEFELDLGKDADGVLILSPDAKTGQPLAEHLGLKDIAYDIEVTPNRPDWLSHIGIAREISILVGRRARLPRPHLREGPESIRKYLTVEVKDPEGCPRFAARMIRGVRLAPSPMWMQNALRAVGLRPRNNIVDITNFVMLECGQPLHAFDYARLSGGKIVVRKALEGTRFETLDGKAHTLPEHTVMVCDGEREVAIAGIMGGANSEINDATVDVVLEAATWNPSSIRRSAKKLGISTDASQRFERGTDPNAPPFALDRAASLILELAGGTLLKGRIDQRASPIRLRSIRLRPGRVNAVLGTALRLPTIQRYLRSLEIEPRVLRGGNLRCTVPSYRVDLVEEIDLIEELARVHGYDSIPEKASAVFQGESASHHVSIADRVRAVLTGLGYQEALTNSMQDRWRASLTGASPVEILNPLGQEMAWLRTSLAPGILDSIARNEAHGTTTLRLYEVGHVFWIDPESRGTYIDPYREEEALCLAMVGSAEPHHWSSDDRPVDLFDLKGATLALLARLGLDKGSVISYSTSDGLTDSSLRIEIEGSVAGYLGRVRADVRERIGIKHDVYLAEVLLRALDRPRARQYASLPRFPKVKRDLAFLVDQSIPAERLAATIRESCGELLSGVTVFDVYEGKGVEAGKRSIAFALELMSRERTLTDAEVEEAITRTARAMAREHGASLRSGQEA